MLVDSTVDSTSEDSDKKILFCFVFQKKLFTFALAFIIHRLMKVIWLDSLAQLVEHNTFNVGVMGSSPMRVTKGNSFVTKQLQAYASLHQVIYQLKKRDYFLKFDAKRVSFECPLFLTLIKMATLSLTVIKAKQLANGKHKVRIAVRHRHETVFIIMGQS